MKFSSVAILAIAGSAVAQQDPQPPMAMAGPPPAGYAQGGYAQGGYARPPRTYGFNPNSLLGGVAHGVGDAVQATAGGLVEAGKGLAQGAGAIAGGLFDTGKGILSGAANAFGGVLGVGSDLIEAIVGIRPWRQTDIDQLNEIRTAIAPIVKRYAAEQ